MTSHQLARSLLQEPDVPVCIEIEYIPDKPEKAKVRFSLSITGIFYNETNRTINLSCQ